MEIMNHTSSPIPTLPIQNIYIELIPHVECNIESKPEHKPNPNTEPNPSNTPTPQVTTLHGCNIEQVKACFISAVLDKDEENALLWGYELYYSELKYDVFYLLNEIYQLFYVDKHDKHFNGYLQTLAIEWEDSKRKNVTILGSMIKNLVKLDISITEMVNHKTPPSNNIIKVLKWEWDEPENSGISTDDPLSSPLSPPLVQRKEPSNFVKMTIEEIVKLKRKLKKLETKPKPVPEKIKIPFYLCHLLEIDVDPKTFIYVSFKECCNIHTKTSAVKTVVLRRKK